jgi:hypothetical protein
MLFLQAPLALPQPITPRPGDRPGLLGAALVEAALGLAQPPAPTLGRSELARQLVAARVTESRVLLGVDHVRLGQDLTRDLLVVARGPGAAFAATLVPSTAITPTRTRPASAHSASTSPNSSANARSWRWRNRAIVV